MILRHKEYGLHQFSEAEAIVAKTEGWVPVEEPATITPTSKVVPTKPKGVDSPVR